MTKILFTLGWNGNNRDRLNYLPTIELIRGIHSKGHEVHLLATDDMKLPEHLEHMRGEFEWLRTLPNDFRTHFGYSHNMEKYLHDHDDYEIYHTNGLLTHLNHLTCSIARKRRLPYVVTPYGMLNDYRPGTKPTLYNRIYRHVYFNSDGRRASCIRAISREEGLRFRRMGVENPIACIPWANPIPDWLDEAMDKGRRLKAERKGRRVGTVLVDLEDATIDQLIAAFAKVAEPEDDLLLMDMGYVNTRARAEEAIAKHRLRNVRIVEQMDEYATTVLITSCCVMALPGSHIFMGPVIARSLLCRVPVIIAHSMDWENVEEINCGWWCPKGAGRLPQLLSSAMMMPFELLDEKGENGRQLIIKEHSASVAADRMLRLYDWLLGKSDRPEFVI